MNELEILKDKDLRPHVCERRFDMFFVWYFQHYISHESPEFHKQMFEECKFDGHRFLMWIMFRESAKTAIARAFCVWCIIYKKKNNIFWIGNDLKKASVNARAVSDELKANPYILRDFGTLYEEEKKKNDISKPKQINQFKTKNGVMFSAGSTAISTRGSLEGQNRPDLYILDDFENDATKKSHVMTQRVIDFVEETITGAAAGAKFIFLCNYISKFGSVAHFVKRAKDNEDWAVHWKAVTEGGKITWPSRFVQTSQEAKDINKDIPEGEHVKSLEAIRANVGTSRFNQEFMNVPTADDDGIVKAEWFENGKLDYEVRDLSKDENGWMYNDGFKSRRLRIVAAIDPAISKKETSDERSIVVAGHVRIDDVDYYLILESVAGRWGLNEFARKIKAVANKYNPSSIGCEDNGVQQVFREAFENAGVSTVSLKPDTDKVRRMYRNVSALEFGHVLFPDDGTCQDVVSELIDFTGEDGRPDNRVDAFNYAIQMLKSQTTSFEHKSDRVETIAPSFNTRF